MNARYYSPNTNRFVAPDPIVPDPANPQSFNRYAYVENRPINFNDPTGHCLQYAGENGDPDELGNCVDAWNELSEFWSVTTEDFPHEYLGLLMEKATTHEIRSILDGFGVNYDPESETYSWGEYYSDQDSMYHCSPGGGGYICPPEDGWASYSSLEIISPDWEIKVLKIIVGFPIGRGMGKLIDDPITSWFVSQIIKRPMNTAIDILYGEMISAEVESPLTVSNNVNLASFQNDSNSNISPTYENSTSFTINPLLPFGP